MPKLKSELNLKNVYEVPKLTKIVLNQGLGHQALQNQAVLNHALSEVQALAAQKGVVRRSKKSISGFKLRPNMPVGLVVVLRHERMYAFLDRLIRLGLPRVRDFQGLSKKSFDRCGNYSLGLEEQLMFPEIDYDQVDQIRGMDITFVTEAKNKHHSMVLLSHLGLPFQKES